MLISRRSEGSQKRNRPAPITKTSESILDEASHPSKLHHLQRTRNLSLETHMEMLPKIRDKDSPMTLNQSHQIDLCRTRQYLYIGEGLCMRNGMYYTVQQTFNLGRHYQQVGLLLLLCDGIMLPRKRAISA